MSTPEESTSDLLNAASNAILIILMLAAVFALGYYAGYEACENEAYRIQIDE